MPPYGKAYRNNDSKSGDLPWAIIMFEWWKIHILIRCGFFYSLTDLNQFINSEVGINYKVFI